MPKNKKMALIFAALATAAMTAGIVATALINPNNNARKQLEDKIKIAKDLLNDPDLSPEKAKELEDQIDKAKKTLKDENSSKENLQDANNKLNDVINQAKENIEVNKQTKLDKQNLENLIKEIKEWNQANMANIAGLAKESQSLADVVSTVEKDNENLDIAKIAKQKETLEQAWAKAKKEKADYDRALSTLKDQIDKANKLLKEKLAQDPNSTALQSARDDLQAAVAKAMDYQNDDLNGLNDKNIKLSEAIKQAEQQLKNYDIRKTELIENLKSAITLSKRWIKDEIENLPAFSNQKNELESKIDKAESYLEKKFEDMTIKELEQLNNDVYNYWSNVKYDKGQYDKKIAELEQKIQLANNQANKMTDPALENAKVELEAAINKANEAKNQSSLNQLPNDISDLQSAIDKANQAMEDLKNQKTNLANEIKDKLAKMEKTFADKNTSENKYPEAYDFGHNEIEQVTNQLNNLDNLTLEDLNNIDSSLNLINDKFNSKVDIKDGEDLVNKMSDPALNNAKTSLQSAIDKMKEVLANNKASESEINEADKKLKAAIQVN
ncbi:hypothetical protein FJO69_02875 [[Mycoplasma] falconis]|uniref:Uncharacterized protein n=1 Tax=[Mycoplasma] falconis TaxID=92403 RepID=A0A501X828_9BACT|nr:hypothetical protein [[Mycoplasma] falconis]TPE56574.1 hypothetical protein FJO69_02875 [[Mycoplasma] falconis]